MITKTLMFLMRRSMREASRLKHGTRSSYRNIYSAILVCDGFKIFIKTTIF